MTPKIDHLPKRWPFANQILYHIKVYNYYYQKKEIPIFCPDVWLLIFAGITDPYFSGLANVDREPATQPISKLEFEFERRKLAKDDVRELIYREVWSYNKMHAVLVKVGLQMPVVLFNH